MKLTSVLFVFAITVSYPSGSYAESGHDHSKEKKGHGDEHEHDDHDHGKKKKKKKHDDHDHGSEEKHKGHDHKEGAKKEDNHGHGHEEEGGHDDHASSNVGPGKAVVEVKNEGQSFRLSDESEQLIGIQTKKIRSSDGENFQIPRDSLVEYQDKQGVFVKKGDWYELVPVKVINRSSDSITIAAHEISAKHQLVIKGLGMLRATHLQLTGQGGQGQAN